MWLRQRVTAASTECSSFSTAIAFSLGKLGLSHISLKKEQRSAILAEYQRRDVSPNRVPWKEYVLPVSTFPDGLQALGRGEECIS